MADITIVGFGPGTWGKLTIEVRDVLLAAERIVMRDPVSWEVARELERRGKHIVSLSSLYLLGLDGGDLYPLMADFVCRTAQRYGPVVYALPGNPMVFETTNTLVRLRARELGLSCFTMEGMSCLDTLFVCHNIDPGFGLQILSFNTFTDQTRIMPEVAALIFQVGAPASCLSSVEPESSNLERLRGYLLEAGYPARMPVYLLKPGPHGQISVECRLGHLEQLEEHLIPIATLYVPPLWMAPDV